MVQKPAGQTYGKARSGSDLGTRHKPSNRLGKSIAACGTSITAEPCQKLFQETRNSAPRPTRLGLPPSTRVSEKVTSSFDLPLIRTLGKAFHWQKVIDTGEMANASELARRFKLDPGWVSEVLRMTRLAPDIIRAILEGRQPRHLNLHAMRGRQAEVPLDWDAQRKLFEFIPPKG